MEISQFEKLQGYYEVKPEEIQKGDIIRYTCSIYNSDDRKCIFATVCDINESVFDCEDYKKQFKWQVDPSNTYKLYRFYKQIPKKPDLTQKPSCENCGKLLIPCEVEGKICGLCGRL